MQRGIALITRHVSIFHYTGVDALMAGAPLIGSRPPCALRGPTSSSPPVICISCVTPSTHLTDRQAGQMNDENDTRKRGTIFLSINLCKNNVTWRYLKQEGSSLAALCGCVYSRERIISRFLKLHYKYCPSEGLEYVQSVDEVLMGSRQRMCLPGQLFGGLSS
jgi:hypothetical protein